MIKRPRMNERDTFEMSDTRNASQYSERSDSH